jgi:hypothetical protein
MFLALVANGGLLWLLTELSWLLVSSGIQQCRPKFAVHMPETTAEHPTMC